MDEILIEVSNRLRTVFKQGTLYRFGGDEFIALNQSFTDDSILEIENIDTIVKKLEYELAKPIIDSEDREHFVGLSMGVVASTVGIDDWILRLTLLMNLCMTVKTLLVTL